MGLPTIFLALDGSATIATAAAAAWCKHATSSSLLPCTISPSGPARPLFNYFLLSAPTITAKPARNGQCESGHTLTYSHSHSHTHTCSPLSRSLILSLAHSLLPSVDRPASSKYVTVKGFPVVCAITVTSKRKDTKQVTQKQRPVRYGSPTNGPLLVTSLVIVRPNESSR
jgi:hypothetical protein